VKVRIIIIIRYNTNIELFVLKKEQMDKQKKEKKRKHLLLNFDEV